jgi:hypothetical protein
MQSACLTDGSPDAWQHMQSMQSVESLRGCARGLQGNTDLQQISGEVGRRVAYRESPTGSLGLFLDGSPISTYSAPRTDFCC